MPSLYMMCPSRWTMLLLLLSTYTCTEAIHMSESNEAHRGSMLAFLRGGNNNNNNDQELNNLHNLEDERVTLPYHHHQTNIDNNVTIEFIRQEWHGVQASESENKDKRWWNIINTRYQPHF